MSRRVIPHTSEECFPSREPVKTYLTIQNRMGTLRHGKMWAIGLDRKYTYVVCCRTWCVLLTFLHRASLCAIKALWTAIVLPPPPYLSFHSSLLLCFFVYPCCLALSLSTHSHFPFCPAMVATTRPKNKLAHPAAPVMTEAAKQKAGIKTKRRPKKATKDETIQELRARIAALENPDEEMFSKEPLVCTTIKPSMHAGL
jgi:hypothetical protein